MKVKSSFILIRNHQLKLRQLWRSRRGAWLLALLLGLITLLATVGLLVLSGWFISAAAYAGLMALSAAYAFNYFVPAAVIRFFAIIRTAGRYGERLASHHAALALLADLRSELFARLLSTPARLMHRHSAGQMHRLTADVDTLNEWPLAMLLPWGWAVLLLGAYACLLAWAGGAAMLSIVFPALLLAGICVPWAALKSSRNLAAKQAEESEARRLALLSPLTALTALLQWGRWQAFAEKFRAQDFLYSHTQRAVSRRAGLFALIQQCFLGAAMGLLLWQGAGLLADKRLSVPVLLALLLGIFGLAEVLLPLVNRASAWGNSLSACRRLNQLLSVAESVSASPLAQAEVYQEISLQDVSAKQPQALNGPEHINLSLYPGDVLIINGESGAGKTTLLDVLAGELVPEAGQIFLNQQPYTHWQHEGRIAYLSQQWMIFDLTLAENLRLGNPEATDEDLWRVLTLVSLKQWAEAQPRRLHTPLGEYGAAVSGGQARRIALARLLLKSYPLLLLDEPFAGLDGTLRQHLYQQLRTHQQNGILVIVSHHELTWGAGVKQLTITGA